MFRWSHFLPIVTNAGSFREVFRFNEWFDGVSVAQLSHSLVKEGVVKAWHGHLYQSQWNYVVSGQIRVAMYDRPAILGHIQESIGARVLDIVLTQSAILSSWSIPWVPVHKWANAYYLCNIWDL